MASPKPTRTDAIRRPIKAIGMADTMGAMCIKRHGYHRYCAVTVCIAVLEDGMVHIQAVVRGWIVRREYGTDVAGIVRVQALSRRWLVHHVARWER